MFPDQQNQGDQPKWQQQPPQSTPPAPQDPFNKVSPVVQFNPEDFPDNAEVQRRHELSVQQYPNLHISQSEFVISVSRRHPFGLFAIWFFTVIVVLIPVVLLPLYASNRAGLAQTFMIDQNLLPSAAVLAIPALVVAALFVLGGFIATYVYNSNKYYLTNESIIQFVRTGLFTTNDKTLNLRNIRDISYRQDGVLPKLFKYGTVRVTTEGEKVKYMLTFVEHPREQTDAIIDAQEHAIGVGSVSNPQPAGPPTPPPSPFNQ